VVTKLKLMPDYECFALWDIDNVENVDPAVLPISDILKKRISKWEEAYDSTLNQEDPPASGFQSPEDERSFDTEGRLIWEELKKELGESYDIRYFSVIENTLI
jgi:hypothetical protein